ncbi:MAG: UDP-N-acetylmuramoyl-L-alanine--D-glutamate ligase [bacterium]|nr:UDP-N-acetylmuramoyl-L-alanine--D-glutamate ligase [bacterium]
MNYLGQKILVLGTGRSGRAAAALLLDREAQVFAYDKNEAAQADLDPRIERLREIPANFDDFDKVVASPGFPVEPGPKVLPEIDLAAIHIEAPIVGVTGTNGKSTVTVLIGRMLEQSGLRTAVGGNLGVALCELVALKAERVVSELSSFQLEHAQRLHARVAVLLNLSPDHLDRHGSMESYGTAKERLAELQQPDDVLVFNLDDAWARAVGERARTRTRAFSTRSLLESGAFVDGDQMVLARDGEVLLRIPISELSHACRSPLANALAAASAAEAAGATAEAIRKQLTEFEGLPHRSQEVCVSRGVRYVDDSKATNPAAAAASVSACEAPVIWIAGGRNKGLDFAPLGEVAGDVIALITYGESAEDLAVAGAQAPEVVRSQTLAEAVEQAVRRARPGYTVLLSPACSSFDQFDSFEARGRAFARLVNESGETPGGGAC